MSTKRLGKNPLLARLRTLDRAAQVDLVPAGWRTVEQWAREWGISRAEAFRLLAFGRRKGLLVRKSFRIHTGRKLYPVPHYAERRP